MLIIFHLDGTLFQTKLCVIAAVKHLFDEIEANTIDEELVISNIGKRTSEFLTNILPKSDIEAAQRYNIPSIGVAYGYGKVNEISMATFMSQNIGVIIGYVNQIELFYKMKDYFIRKEKKIIGINGVDTSGKTEFTITYSKFLSSLKIKNAIIHIEFEEVLKRARIRDVPKYGEEIVDKYIHKYIPIQKKYLEEWEPEQRSDIVINNQDYLNPILCSN